MARTRVALDAYVEQPDVAAKRMELREALRGLANAVAELAPARFEESRRGGLGELIKRVSGSGYHDLPVAEVDLAQARAHAAGGGAGLYAAMLLVAGWQWPDAPALKDVPAGAREDYVSWLFAVPQGFSAPGQAALYPQRVLQRLEELLRFVRGEPEGENVRHVLSAYLSNSSCIPLYFCEASLRRHYEVRAQLLQCAVVRPARELRPLPRAGRRLRVGFINRHFGSQTETYTTLPMFEQLDPERFEVVLFAHHANGSALEAYAQQRAAAFHLLPEEAGAQVDALRAAELDVAVFGTNVTAVFNEVTRLALHRVAPLQVVNNSSCTTTGMPEIDLYVSGTLTESEAAPEHFSERLGLVAGPAHAFNYEADRQEPTSRWTRAALGLPEDAVLFVTAANYFKIIPEMQRAWAKLLAGVPGSRLLVHPFNPNWSSSYPVKRFAAEFDAVLAEHGVASDRWVLSTMKFPSRSDVKELLSVGDVYLDTFPFGGVNSLVDPLELGMPVIAWEGATFRSRMGAALLRTLGLDELIAGGEAGYLERAVSLAREADRRNEIKQRVADAMGRMPLFLDTLAASDAFGALLETAFDELQRVGRAEFRRQRTPIRVPAPMDAMARINDGVARLEADDPATAAACAREVLGAMPAHPAARHLLGAALLRGGQHVRAVDYFLGAVQHSDGDAPLWHDLAIALCESGRMPQAVQALETSLRIDQSRVEGWTLLAELALNAGNIGLYRDALGVARELAPADERVSALVMRGDAIAGGNDDEGRKHVLLFTDDPEHGGVAQYNHAVLLALIAEGYRVTCAQSKSESPLIEEQRAAGVRHVWIDYDTGREFGRTLGDHATARHILAAMRPDFVLFSNCCPLSNFAAEEVAKETGVPFAIVVHFVGAYLAQNFAGYIPALGRVYRAASDVVAVSAENLRLLRSHFDLPCDRGRVIYNGRPERFFMARDPENRARLRAEIGVPEEAMLCLTTARLAAVKGFEHQLRALASLEGTPVFRRLHFAWAGEGEQRGELEAQIARLGFGSRIHLLGHRWDVADWYDAADVFVLPSYIEGMPLSVMEAMAKGLAVAASAVSGTPEALGDTGRLLADPARDPAGTERDLAAALSEWAADSEMRERMGAASRERAIALFQEARMTCDVLDLVAGAILVPSAALND